MVNCRCSPCAWMNGQLVPAQADQPEGREGIIAYRILEQHNTSGDMKTSKSASTACCRMTSLMSI